MSSRKQCTSAIVYRDYKYAPDYCARAVELLLKNPLTSKKGGPDTAPDDAKGLKNDRATDIIPG